MISFTRKLTFKLFCCSRMIRPFQLGLWERYFSVSVFVSFLKGFIPFSFGFCFLKFENVSVPVRFLTFKQWYPVTEFFCWKLQFLVEKIFINLSGNEYPFWRKIYSIFQSFCSNSVFGSGLFRFCSWNHSSVQLTLRFCSDSVLQVQKYRFCGVSVSVFVLTNLSGCFENDDEFKWWKIINSRLTILMTWNESRVETTICSKTAQLITNNSFKYFSNKTTYNFNIFWISKKSARRIIYSISPSPSIPRPS